MDTDSTQGAMMAELDELTNKLMREPTNEPESPGFDFAMLGGPIDYEKSNLLELICNLNVHETFLNDFLAKVAPLVKLLGKRENLDTLVTLVIAPKQVPLCFEKFPRPTEKYVVRITFETKRENEVYILGTFLDNWTRREKLTWDPIDRKHVTEVLLPPGKHLYKFIIAEEEEERWSCDPDALQCNDGFYRNNYVVVEDPRKQPNRLTAIHFSTELLTSEEIAECLLREPEIVYKLLDFMHETDMDGINPWDWFKVMDFLFCKSRHTAKLQSIIDNRRKTQPDYQFGDDLAKNLGKEHVFQLLADMVNPNETVLQWADYLAEPYNFVHYLRLNLERTAKLPTCDYRVEVYLQNIVETVRTILLMEVPQLQRHLLEVPEFTEAVYKVTFREAPIPVAKITIELVTLLVSACANEDVYETEEYPPPIQFLLKPLTEGGDNPIACLAKYLGSAPFERHLGMHLGFFRHDCVNTLLQICMTNYDIVDRAIYASGIVDIVLELFFEHKLSNVFHSIVTHLLETIFYCENTELLINWMKSTGFIKRICAEIESENEQEKENGGEDVRQYVGHLRLVLEKLEHIARMAPEIGEFVSSELPESSRSLFDDDDDEDDDDMDSNSVEDASDGEDEDDFLPSDDGEDQEEADEYDEDEDAEDEEDDGVDDPVDEESLL